MNRERREIIYSIIIIIFIPLLFVSNTVLLTTRVRNDSNRSLKRSADQTNTVLVESLRKSIESKDYKLVNDQVISINKEQPNIGSVLVAIKSNDSFSIVAQTADTPKTLSSSEKLQLSLVFDRQRAVAVRIDAKTSDGRATKGWKVISPLIKDDGVTEAAISTNILTSDAEELIDNTLMISFVATAIAIVVIIVLLFHHFRFVGYADLLNRQKEVNQTMRDFMSVATHELRAPMTIIKGYIAEVTEGSFGEINDAIRKSLNTAVAQTERLNNLVQDLLNVSRIEQGKLTIDMQKVDMVTTINTLVGNYTERAKSKNLQLIYVPENAVPVMADGGRVQEIMTNLIDNAFKYTQAGSITIKHRVEGKTLVTSVIDTGPGLSSEEQSRLFQRFYRVKNDNTKDIPGTGLGLWIIKQYAEMMGGKIMVSSIVGVGTEFSVSLKLAD